MPLLAAFLGACFTALVDVFGKYLAKKAAVTLTTIALLGTAWAAMFVGIKAAVAAVSVTVPSEFSTVASMVAPTGYAATLSLLWGGLLAIHSYKSFKEKTLATNA